MSAPTTPLKWSSKKRDTHAASASASREYHLKSPSNASYHYQPPSTQQRSPNSVAGVGTRGGSTHSSNGARSRAGSTSSGSGRMTAVFCDVVVEGAGRTSDGWDLPPEIMSFLPTLGSTLVKPTSSPAFPTTPSKANLEELASHTDRPPDIERRRNLLLELIKTEETYVKRLNVLYKLYAFPLRDYTRRKDMEIINAFEAKQIFGNIEAILPANEALLADLRHSLYGDNAGHALEHWASVMLRHLEHFQSVYPAYILNLERAKDLERELRRRNPVFKNFIERTRESAGAGSDNCSLESLLIEPAQRIPRYRLLLKGIVREIDKDDKYRSVILDAIETASSIAALDEDEDTRRAAALFGLGRSIDGLPPRITNSSRYFVDCIDVFDRPLSSTSRSEGGTPASHGEELLCTLFLFSDRLIIAKRDSAEGTGRSLAGLDNINKLVKEMQMPDPALSRSKSPRKNKAKSMRFRGDFDLGELVAKDENEISFSLFLERPPAEFSDRWNGRSLRKFQILKPETPGDKSRFLSNIWNCAALLKGGRNHATTRLWSNGTLSAYWNIYDKRSYLSEHRKAKIALQICAGSESVTELPFGMQGPHAVATAYFGDDGSCDYCIRIRNSQSESHYEPIAPAKLVGYILQTARHLRLYDTPPAIPGIETVLRRDDSRVSSASRPLSASSSRPRSVMDFMRSPGGSIQSSPRRTLSKASKASTADSRNAASIFSGEYASTARTSIMSQDSHGSPQKRPLSSLTRTSPSAPNSAPAHVRTHSESRKYFRATSTEPEQHTQDSAKDRPMDSQVPTDAVSHLYNQNVTASQEINTDDAYDQNALSRSRSDSSLYKSSSSQSLSRSRSQTLSRCASTQSMRIDEEDDEEILQNHHVKTPERVLSPPLQRSGTISRPMGPRHLGSRSPAASPQPMYLQSQPVTAEATLSRTPSPLNDDDPFMPSTSTSKKRYHNGDPDPDDSFAKRALRELQDGSTEVYSKSSSSEESESVLQSRTRSERRDHVTRSRAAAADIRASEGLQRTGSLPRSPNTRSLYQRSRNSGEPSSVKPSPLVKSALPLQSSRLPRKPVPDSEDQENQPVSTHANALAGQHELETLQKSLRKSEMEIAELTKQLHAKEAEHTAEMEAFSEEAIGMANKRIEQETASRDARIAALEAEVRKVKNENRALQALLRNYRA